MDKFNYTPNWEQRRYEIAKQALCSLIGQEKKENHKHEKTMECAAKIATLYSDALIRELQKGMSSVELVKCGDFVESKDLDSAILLGDVFGLEITKGRAGFPFHKLDEYVQKLQNCGYCVIMED